MDEARALAVLDLVRRPPADFLEQHLEDLVFPLRDYFLRNTVIAPLFRSRSKRLLQMAEAAEALGMVFSPYRADAAAGLQKDTLLDLLSSYEAELAYCRLRISGSFNPHLIASEAERAIAIQEAYESGILVFSEGLEAQAEVRAADQYDSGRFVLHLKSGDQNAIEQALSHERGRIMALGARAGRSQK